MNERNKSKKEYRLKPYPKHIINNIQTQIVNNPISPPSIPSIQIAVTDYEQSSTSLLGQHNTNQFKNCSKDNFTPRQIYLWVKILELIVHLSKDLNEKLNSDFISIKWI